MTKKQFNLSRERRKAGLTQVQLAEKSGVDERTIQNHEAKGVPLKLMEKGYEKIFEECANK